MGSPKAHRLMMIADAAALVVIVGLSIAGVATQRLLEEYAASDPGEYEFRCGKSAVDVGGITDVRRRRRLYGPRRQEPTCTTTASRAPIPTLEALVASA